MDGAPKPVLEKANKEDAEKAKAQLEGPAPPSSSSSQVGLPVTAALAVTGGRTLVTAVPDRGRG